jgi:very-short-patch-repair endonuclease
MRAKKRTGHGELAALATRQHGVVATRQLRDLGYRENLIVAESSQGRGRLRRVYRGVYAVGHESLTPKGWCMAAVLTCAPAIASHWSAGWLWGLNGSPSVPHLTAPTRRHPRRGFAVHFARLPPEDVTEVDAIPVTSVERTVLDLAASAPRRIEWFLETLEKRQALDLRRFESLLDRSFGHPGYGPLKKALALYREDFDPAFTRSKLEARFRRLLRSTDLPMPQANVYVGSFELDCYWEPERFAVELDTFGTHGSRRSFEADRRRQRVLALQGIALERVTDNQLRDEPEEILASIAGRLRERRTR